MEQMEETCLICLEGGNLIATCKCSARCHEECIKEWMQKQKKQTCMMCKREHDSVSVWRTGVACDTKMLSVTVVLLLLVSGYIVIMPYLKSIQIQTFYMVVLGCKIGAYCALWYIYMRDTGTPLWCVFRNSVATSAVCLESGALVELDMPKKWTVTKREVTLMWDSFRQTPRTPDTEGEDRSESPPTPVR